MSRRRAPTGSLLPLALALALVGARAPAHAGPGVAPVTAQDPLERARLLHRFAAERLDDPTVEARQRCVRDLQDAIALDPAGRAGNHWLLLGRVRELARMNREAGVCYRTACVQRRDDPESWLALAGVYRRDWLRTLDRDALRAAVGVLDTAALVRPKSSTVWTALCPLLYELPDMPRAADAAERALRGYPRAPEAALAAALMAWRTGDLERADSLFRATLPRLAPDLRALFEHPGRFTGKVARPPSGLIVTEDEAADSLAAPEAKPAVADHPERDALPDPDPTTPENELLLEYWSRVAHAYLLFNDPLWPGLDARAETYIRYGPPAKVLLNPPGVQLFTKSNTNASGRNASLSEYALDAQVWSYPELGLSILLHDRSLVGRYTQPALREPWPGSIPDARALAHRADLFATDGGFAVFPTLAPRGQRLDVTGTLAAFAGATGPRLTAFVQAPGDSLEARWSVTDARGKVVARGAHAMGHSPCDVAMQADAFNAELPPGRYDVAVSARDRHGRRGTDRGSITLERALAGLAVSDLVACCGGPAVLVDRGAIRLVPMSDRVVRGSAPLSVYFEIYRLAAGDDGFARYTFDYRVERLLPDDWSHALAPSGTFTTWASREEVFKGDVRRQFISVPVAALPAGHYRLVVGVHDTLAGLSETRALDFERK